MGVEETWAARVGVEVRIDAAVGNPVGKGGVDAAVQATISIASTTEELATTSLNPGR